MSGAAIDWSSFLARYRPMALRFVRGLLASEDLAEDVFQEAARATWERGRDEGFESTAHARNYLYRTLRNVAVDTARDRGRRAATLDEGTEPADRAPTPLDLAADAERRAGWRDRYRAVVSGLRSLRPPERDALAMRLGRGLTYREIEERTGVSISTLQARVTSALEKLRRKIGNPPPEV